MENQPQSRLLNSKPTNARQAAYSPAAILDVPDKDENYAYRWIKLEGRTFIGGTDTRGWELVRNGGAEEVLTGSVSQFSNRALGSLRRVNGLALARMPIEKAQARNDYFKKKAAQQVRQEIDVKKKLEIAKGGVKKFKVFGAVERG